VGHGLDQPLLLQPAQQPAREARVQAQRLAQTGHVGDAPADGVQHARGAQGPAAAEEGGVQRTHLDGDGAVEPANAGDRVGSGVRFGIGLHLSDFSQTFTQRQRRNK